MPAPPFGTSYFDQSGNFCLNGGKIYSDTGEDITAHINGIASIAAASGDVVGPASAVDGNVVLFDGATGKLLKDSALALSGTNTGDVAAASAAEINTGTDATKTVTPDALAGSLHGERVVQIEVFPPATNCATGDGKKYFVVPAPLNGMNLIGIHGRAITAGTTGTMDVQVANVTDTVDMLSTKLTWDTTEAGTNTAAAPAVIDATKDDVATNDLLRIDVDAVQTTPAAGMIITLRFQLP